MSSWNVPQKLIAAGTYSKVLGRKVPGKFSEGDIRLNVSTADQQNPNLQVTVALYFSADDVTWIPQGAFVYHAGSLIPAGVPLPGITVDLRGDAGMSVRLDYALTVDAHLGLDVTLT